VEAGEDEEAEAVLRETISLADRGAPGDRVFPRVLLSTICCRRSAIAEAHTLLSEACEEAGRLGSQAVGAVWVSWAEAHLAVAEGRWPEALAAFSMTAGGFDRMGMPWFRARTLREWAEAHLSQGEMEDRERAQGLLREAEAEFAAMGVPLYAAQVQQRLEELGAG
jgi:hypothetical protein